MNNSTRQTLRTGWTRWYRRTLPAYWIFLFCVTHFPKLSLNFHVPDSDKIAHFAAFGLLAFLLWRFAETIRRPLSHRFIWLAWAGLAVYAALDELTQPYFNRSCDFFDWLNDMIGAGAVFALLEWRRRHAARTAPPAPPTALDSPAPPR